MGAPLFCARSNMRGVKKKIVGDLLILVKLSS